MSQSLSSSTCWFQLLRGEYFLLFLSFIWLDIVKFVLLFFVFYGSKVNRMYIWVLDGWLDRTGDLKTWKLLKTINNENNSSVLNLNLTELMKHFCFYFLYFIILNNIMWVKVKSKRLNSLVHPVGSIKHDQLLANTSSIKVWCGRGRKDIKYLFTSWNI